MLIQEVYDVNPGWVVIDLGIEKVEVVCFQ